MPSPSWLLRIAALLVLVAPLGSTLHLVGTAHHVCPEHGEIEHGAQLHAAPPTSALTDVVVDAVPGEADHEHCDTVGLLKSASPLAPLTALSAPPSLPQAPVCQSRPACVALALLALAPKTSPPVAA